MPTNQAILDRIYSNPKPSFVNPESPLAKIQSKKKPWKPFELTPVEPNVLTLSTGTYQAVQRCIALAVALELPVGHLALNGSESAEGYQDIQTALTLNAHDEDNHFKAFEYAANAYGVPDYLFEEVEHFRDRLINLEEDPVLLAGFMELTVFFVTLAMMRQYGSPDLKRLAHYVSRDEVTHVNTNYNLVDSFGLRFNNPDSVDALRIEIVNWLTQDISEENRYKWLGQSNSLKETRKAPDLEWTKTANFIAFFEVPRDY